jgi:molybdate transport system permease protein
MDFTPVLISLKSASASIVFTFFLGIFAAWGVASIEHKTLRSRLDGVLILPLVLPPTVAGFFLLYLLGIRRPFGRLLLELFSIRIPFTWRATVIAAVLISFPLMYRSARGAFEQVNENIIFAARTIGMSERSIFWKIRMAVALPGIVSGGILAFTRGLGEFGATAMIAGNIAGVTRTLPMAVYSSVVSGDEETVLGYVAIMLLVAFIAVAWMNYFTARELKTR